MNVVINNWCYAWDIDDKPPLLARRETPIETEKLNIPLPSKFKKCKFCRQEFVQECTENTCSNECRKQLLKKGE